MKEIILVLIGVGIGYLLGKQEGLPVKKGENLIEKQAREKEENKQQILGLLETQSPLTNNNVEQLLGISDATATRYLEELEKEGKVKQVGDAGRYVSYELKK